MSFYYHPVLQHRMPFLYLFAKPALPYLGTLWKISPAAVHMESDLSFLFSHFFTSIFAPFLLSWLVCGECSPGFTHLDQQWIWSFVVKGLRGMHCVFICFFVPSSLLCAQTKEAACFGLWLIFFWFTVARWDAAKENCTMKPSSYDTIIIIETVLA